MRTAIVGVCAYAALVALLRISGKRTLSQMNAFDFVVTVALGSALATVLLSKDTPLAEGVLALAVLVLVQFVITWSSVRWRVVDHVVKSEPRLLVHRGQLLRAAMKAERVREGEVFQAMRSHGVSAGGGRGGRARDRRPAQRDTAVVHHAGRGAHEHHRRGVPGDRAAWREARA